MRKRLYDDTGIENDEHRLLIDKKMQLSNIRHEGF